MYLFKRQLILIFFSTCLMNGQTIISGNVSGTWDVRNSPYQLSGDVLVQTGDTLIVNSGVVVRALGSFELRAAGTLVMSNARLTQGDGIFVDAGSANLSNCRIDSTANGAQVFGGTLRVNESIVEAAVQSGVEFHSAAQGFVTNSTIQNCGRYGIRITGSNNVHIRNNTLIGNSTSNTTYPALFIDSCSPDSVMDNLMVDNHAQGIGVWALTGSAAPMILHNLVKGNFTGITIVNGTPMIKDNIVVGNFVTGNSNSGAGLYIGYPNGNPICTGNLIAGNYYGVSIVNSGSANLGDIGNTAQNDNGVNLFAGNSLNGVTWNIWNSTPNAINAQNNLWLDENLNNIDQTIYDDNESGTSGVVTFQPISTLNATVSDLNHDEIVNVADAVVLIEMILENQIPEPVVYYFSDVNQDFMVNILDVTTLINQILVRDQMNYLDASIVVSKR